MITPAFGLTATERVLPKLALDFTTASLDSRVTFTRTTGAANPATYVGSNGYITAATNNQPRFDYDPVALTCKGLLIEESRANLFLYSEQFQQADWIKSSVTVDDDAIASPDGTTNADKVILDSGVASASGVIRQQITKAASAITYTCSFYAKAGEFNSMRVIFRDTASSANFVQAYFNLNLGTVSTAANAGGTYTNPSASIAAAGNGWYRCVLTGTTGTNTTTDMRVLQYNNGNSSVTGDGASGLYLWGAQLEAGAFATSYIPTTTTALTRNADVATMTGTNLTDWCDTTKGTIFSQQVVAQFNAANTIYAYSLGSAAAVEVYAGMSTAGANQFTVINTTNQANFAGFSAGTLNTPQKVCGYYQANNFAASANGVAGGTDVSGTVPTINKLVFGARNDGARVLNGWIQKFSYWPFTLTTSEVTAFSK